MIDPRSRDRSLHPIDAFVGGIAFVFTTPSMWPLAAVPAFVLTILLIGLTALGIWGAAELSDLLIGPDREVWGEIGYWVLTVVLSLVALLIALVLALALAEPFSAFALERISLAQQRAVTGTAAEPPSLLLAIWLSVSCITFSVTLGGAALVTLFVVNFIFPPAVVVTVPLKMLVLSWMIAWNLLDYPLSLRGMGLSARLHWVWEHFGAFTMFGFLWSMLAIVPGVILVFLPMGVAGATQLVLGDDPKPADDVGQAF
jgi:CysZ protein